MAGGGGSTGRSPSRASAQRRHPPRRFSGVRLSWALRWPALSPITVPPLVQAHAIAGRRQ
jgi:hypothetical protein